MTFKPINGHVEVRPILEGGVVQREVRKYEEKGTVVGWDDALTSHITFPIGAIAYFDGWLPAKYGADTDEERWLVKLEDIRAVEYE